VNTIFYGLWCFLGGCAPCSLQVTTNLAVVFIAYVVVFLPSVLDAVGWVAGRASGL